MVGNHLPENTWLCLPRVCMVSHWPGAEIRDLRRTEAGGQAA